MLMKEYLTDDFTTEENLIHELFCRLFVSWKDNRFKVGPIFVAKNIYKNPSRKK